MTSHETRDDVDIRSRWYHVDGVRWHVRAVQEPTGAPRPAVVLVQGFVISSWFHEPLMNELGTDFDVYAPDLPGFGRSDSAGTSPSVVGHAAQVARWIEVAGIGPALVLGTSYGSQVAAELAARHPGVVERVVLVSPTIEPAARPLHRLLFRWLRESGREAGMLARGTSDYLRAGPRRSVLLFRAMRTHHVEDTAPEIGVPALVVLGDDDPLVSREWGEELTARIPDARLEVIPGEPHPLNFTSAEPLARVIRPFFATASSAAQRQVG